MKLREWKKDGIHFERKLPRKKKGNRLYCTRTDKPDNLESLIISRLNRLTQAKGRLEKQEGKNKKREFGSSAGTITMTLEWSEGKQTHLGSSKHRDGIPISPTLERQKGRTGEVSVLYLRDFRRNARLSVKGERYIMRKLLWRWMNRYEIYANFIELVLY